MLKSDTSIPSSVTPTSNDISTEPNCAAVGKGVDDNIDGSDDILLGTLDREGVREGTNDDEGTSLG
jgi:hypothetical protein